MKIFISYTSDDKSVYQHLATTLQEIGHEVLNNNTYMFGLDIAQAYSKMLVQADVVIALISEKTNSQGSGVGIESELMSAMSFAQKSGKPMIMPIILGDNTSIPYYLQGRLCYRFLIENEKHYDEESPENDTPDSREISDRKISPEDVGKIVFSLSSYEAKIEQGKQEQKKSEEKVQKELSNYIQDVFIGLKASEQANKKYALILYLVSIIALISTSIIAIVYVCKSDWKPDNIIPIIAYGILSLFAIIIMVSLSKLLFTLARSFMVEAIRCSDRIHAISFGKFFLDAYGTEATREEVLKAFSSWNIDNGSTSFRNQSAEDYDPKIVDLISVFKKTQKN